MGSFVLLNPCGGRPISGNAIAISKFFGLNRSSVIMRKVMKVLALLISVLVLCLYAYSKYWGRVHNYIRERKAQYRHSKLKKFM